MSSSHLTLNIFMAPFEANVTLYPFFAAFVIGIKFVTVKTLGVIITVIIILPFALQ
jgi:hypothetical protein